VKDASEGGEALFRAGRIEDAEAVFRQAVALNPQDAAAWCNLGIAQQRLGRLSEARSSYERCLAVAPNHPDALANYAFLLAELGEPARSAELPRAITDREPVDIDALYNLALVLLLQWSLPEAETHLRRLLGLAPKSAAVWGLLGVVLEWQSRTQEALQAFHRSVAIEPNPLQHSKMLCCMHYAADVTAERLLDAHREWDVKYAQAATVAVPSLSGTRGREAKLRVGVVSADFGLHPVAFLGLPAFEDLAKSRCSLICYSDRAATQNDAYTDRFRQVSDHWRVICGNSDEEVAAMIRDDKIDVLFDLMGHTGKRLLVFARKPAPIQVTWLGYVGTTGMRTMDYLLADRFHVRPDEDKYCVEQILRLPDDYACYSPPSDAPNIGPLPAATVGQVMFGCFNNPAKYSSLVLGAWASILDRVPGSRLFLKYRGLHEVDTQARIRGHVSERGVDPGRIVMEGASPHSELLAAYSRVDIGLDTQPYSGGVTTCEALWMGVPVITFPGRTFAGRHATSHMTNAGYPQFVADDLEGYIELAVSWANQLDELAILRSQMREQVRHSPLCDAPRFARDFMDVIESAWKAKVAER